MINLAFMVDSILNWADTAGFNFFILLMLVSGLILCAGFCISRLLCRSSAANRSTAWQATFVALAMIPFGALLLPEMPLGWSSLPMVGGGNTANEQNSLQLVANQFVRTDSPPNSADMLDLHADAATLNDSPDAQDTASSSLISMYGREKSTRSSILIDGSVETKSSAITPTPTWRAMLVIAWILGVVFAIARLIWAFCQAQGIVNRAQSFDKERKQHDGIVLLVSNEIEIPVTTGMINPKVILPESSSRWSELRSRLVLLHEQAHIDRCDVAWHFFATVVSSIFWFQPLVWLAESQMKMEREHACDDQVLRQGETASDYAQVLFEFAAELRGQAPKYFGALSMAQKPICLLYTSPSPRDKRQPRMPSSA